MKTIIAYYGYMDYDQQKQEIIFIKKLSKKGINKERIIFNKKSPTNEYLLKLKHADLFLTHILYVLTLLQVMHYG